MLILLSLYLGFAVFQSANCLARCALQGEDSNVAGSVDNVASLSVQENAKREPLSDAEKIALCRAIDAGIQSLRNELEFFGAFELRSEWRTVNSLEIAEFTDFGAGGDENMERADGELFKFGDAVGVTFHLRSRLRQDGGYYSYRYFERRGVAIKYLPKQQFEDRTFISEQISLLPPAPRHAPAMRSLPGHYFCPWVSSGLADGRLFGRLLDEDRYVIQVDEGVNPQSGTHTYTIRVSERANDRRVKECVIEWSGRFPKVHEIRNGLTDRITFRDFVEFENGAFFPRITVTSRGPLQLPGNAEGQYDVKLWRFLQLGERPANRLDFQVDVKAGLQVQGTDSNVESGQFNALDYFESPASSTDSLTAMLPLIERADFQWFQRSNLISDRKSILRSCLQLVAFCGLVWLSCQWLQKLARRVPNGGATSIG